MMRPWGGALRLGFVPFSAETAESSLPRSLPGHSKKAAPVSLEQSPHGNQTSGTLTLDFSATGTVGNKFLRFEPLSLFVTAA